jgi:hypothetical protein
MTRSRCSLPPLRRNTPIFDDPLDGPPGIETKTQQPSALGNAWNGLLGTSMNETGSEGAPPQFGVTGSWAVDDSIAIEAAIATTTMRLMVT